MPEQQQIQQKLLSRRTVLEMLIDMEIEPGATWKMQLIPPGEVPADEWEWLPGSAVDSPSGLALITRTIAPGDPEAYLAIAPPFPITEFGKFSEFSQLAKLLKHRWTIAIVLLRLGHFSFGIAVDEKLTVHKTGGRYVKNRQRKGGQSAARFVRNREKAIQQLFDQVAEVARSRVAEHEGHIDWLAFGGDRNVILQFMKRLTLPAGLTDRVAPWRVPVERPGINELSKAVVSAWSCRVWERPAD
jgi:peptide subunit release factor 1 (eRF1)